MTSISVTGGGGIRGQIQVPGDKSISHRSLIFNALSSGRAEIEGLLESEDVHSTRQCLKQLGVSIQGSVVTGTGGRFSEPTTSLYCGNSGTTIRLLMGAIAAQRVSATLIGDGSLHKRPMARIAAPLAQFGADIDTTDGRPPVHVRGRTLTNGEYESSIASAQVKTALLLAALQSKGRFQYREPYMSRDHSERMLSAMGADLTRQVHSDGSHSVTLQGPQRIKAVNFVVPGDISSAAFLMVAASILPQSDILLTGVGINPTRTGVIDVLSSMGASIELLESREVGGEPVADIRVKSSPLNATQIDAKTVPRLVDEIPVLAVAMAHAEGTSSVRGAAELRVKESDRIETTLGIIDQLGVRTQEFEDGFSITGSAHAGRRSIDVDADGDHRTAMSAIIAAMAGEGVSVISGCECIETSFPDFWTLMETLRG